MKLGGHKVGMNIAGQFENLHYLVLTVPSGEDQSSGFELGDVVRIDFESMPESLTNVLGSVEQFSSHSVRGDHNVLPA